MASTELLAISAVAAEMMLKWVTLVGHWQQQSIFVLNLQGETYCIYLFIYFFLSFLWKLLVLASKLCAVVVGKADYDGGTELLS